MKIFETILYKDKRIIYLKEHYKRLAVSVNEILKSHTNSGCLKFISYEECKTLIEKKISAFSTNNYILLRIRFLVEIHLVKKNKNSCYKYLCNIENYKSESSDKKTSLQLRLRNSNQNFLHKLSENFPQKKNVSGLLYHDENNFITECGYSNIFFIDEKNKKIVTPKIDVKNNIYLLPGIIREKITQLFKADKKLKYTLEVRNIKKNEIENFTSAFITNSLIGVLVVNKINNITLDKTSLLVNSIMKELNKGA